MSTSLGRAFVALLLVLAYLGLTALFTYPLVFHAGSHHVGEAGGDAKVYLWNYWWTKRALVELGTSPLETDVIFHPIGIGLALHTLALFQGLVFVPLSSALGGVAAANAIVLWTFVASALAAYALARRVGADATGAFLAGMIFAFAPCRLARLSGHYDLLGTEWIPLFALLALELARRERASKGLVVLTGAVAAACGYTALTYFVFLALFAVLLLALDERRSRLFSRLAASGAVAVLLLSPLLYRAYVDSTSWTYLPYPGADRYAADFFSYVTPTPRQNVLGATLGRSFDENLSETSLFAGYLALGLAAAGLFLRRRIAGLGLWLAGAFVFFVLSLGSSLHFLGVDTGVPLPFRLLTALPLLDHLRAPSRLAVLTMLALSMIVALVVSHLTRRVRFRAVIAAAAGAFLAAEYLALPAPLFESGADPLYRELRGKGSGAVVEIPGIEQATVETMYHQTFHERPIVVGTAARVPREKSEYYFGLPLVRPLIDLRKGRLELSEELLARERESAPRVARFLGISTFVVDRGYEKRGVVRFLEEVLPLDAVDRSHENEGVVVLEVRREELPPDPLVLEAGAPESRQHFESGWARPESDEGASFRWADRERSTLLFRRPSLSVGTVTLEVAPLEGLSQSIAIRLDGRSLGETELRSGWQAIDVSLPPPRGSPGVERLTLRWSSMRTASERDPRTLAARVKAVRFR